MPRKKFTRKTGYALAAVACGISFVAYGYISSQSGDEAELKKIQSLFKDKNVPIATNTKQGGQTGNVKGASQQQNEAKPEFVAAPDYKTALAIAKIYEYGLNPEKETEWLKQRMATRAQRQATTRATLSKQEAKAELDREKYLQQADAVRNGQQLASPDTNAMTVPNGADRNTAVSEYKQPKIQLRGYRKSQSGASASATLEVDGTLYRAVQEGVMIAGFSITTLSDRNKCVTLVDSNNASSSTTKVCI